jgi:hypothetical protein
MCYIRQELRHDLNLPGRDRRGGSRMLQLSTSFDEASLEVGERFKLTGSGVGMPTLRMRDASSFVRWRLSSLLLHTAYARFRALVVETYAREEECN